MPSHLLAVVAMGSMLSSLPAAGSPASPEGLAASSASGAIRTDRLSRKQLEAWNQIVEIVKAEDRDGQPLHPTLRGLWNAVDSSGHVVYVELVRSKKSYTAGRFEVTSVDPEGVAHEARVLLNLRALDRVSTGPAAARADGFIPFEGLGKKQRYAELLGHELAHAVWHLADPERARLAQRLQGEMEALMQRVLSTRSPSARDELMEQAQELDRLAQRMEETAEAAELKIWEELRTGKQRR